jgi:ABC-2 type transport system permease protein
MKKVIQIAVREFVATVSNKAFVIGLLIGPAMIALFGLVAPRMFSGQNFKVEGEFAIVDPTGLVVPEVRTALDSRKDGARRAQEAQRALEQAPQAVRELAGRGGSAAVQAALGPVADLRLIERTPDADIQREKAWLTEEKQTSPHLALVVIHRDAVASAAENSGYGTYDMYVPTNFDDRVDNEIQATLRDALVNARIHARSLDRETIDAIVRVPRIRSVTVTTASEQQTVRGLNILMPLSVIMLLFIGVMTGGQALLTSTVEEKSSRVIEVLLSAVSPMQLMAGKLLGQLAVSLLVLGLYIGLGLALLTSFSLFGLFNPWLILYVIIFFLILYLVIGSLMMAAGSAVNDMREAQSFMMPIMLVLIVPWVLWMPISRDPNSLLSIVLSFLPPINSFAMMLRMASTAPPPWWQVWLSIGIGVASVFAAIWFAAKVFRIGLLLYGKPPSLKTLIRWARSA